LASTAAVTLSTHSGAIPAGAKTSNTDKAGGDSFADMLAAADTAMPAPTQAAEQATISPDAALSEDAGCDADTEAAETPAAALPQAEIKPQLALPSGKGTEKTGAKDDTAAKDGETPLPANDNMNVATALPIPAQMAAAQADKTAPAGIDALSRAGATPPSQAADEADAQEDGAAPQIAGAAAKDVTPRQAAARSAKSDFKKALDDTKSDTASVPAADSGKDAKAADAKPAGPQAADARPADPSAPHANAPQPDALGPVTMTASTEHSRTAAASLSAGSQDTAAPAPHQAPNLESLAVNIAAKSQGGAKQFDIRLDPPELGRVEVRLSIDATGKAEAHLTADQPQTLDLLQKDAPALTRALREAGLDVNQDGLNFSLRNQQQQAGQQQGSSQGGRAWRGGAQTGARIETAQAAGAYAPRGLSLLDIKV
jgi:flagellar hook-length control protein FliK